MTPSEVIELFRARADDEATPYLWEDEELLHYMIEAQDEIVRHFGGFNDVTVGTPATGRLDDLTLTANDPYSTASPYIIRYRRGRLITADKDITFSNQADLKTTWFKDYTTWTINDLDDTETGDVDYGLLDIREGKIRWLYVPDANDTCRLWFTRLPYPRITTVDDSLELEEQYHRDLVEWMLRQAYLKPDEEVYDLKKSQAAEARFNARMERIAQERSRKRYKPRAVHYGGIRW